jgi:general secretion pathway protein C
MSGIALDSPWRSPAEWPGLFLANGPKLATGILGVLIAVQLALLVTDFLAGPPAASGAASAAPAATADNRPQFDVVALMNAHLFGQAANNVDSRNAPTTSMAMVLAGTIASEDPRKGFALIGDSAASARVYAVGSTLPSGVRLHEVYRDRVIIDRGGVLEALLLPRNAPLLGAPPRTTAATGPQNPLQAAQEALQRNPDALSEIVRAQPVGDLGAGKIRGVRVFPGRNMAAFSKLGLRAGDLVTSVNGTPLDDPNRALEIFGTLQSVPEARVGVIRNGRPAEIMVNMTEVTRQVEQVVGTEGMTPASALPPVQGADPDR